MKKTSTNGRVKLRSLAKAPTGIHGLDEITLGGLPKGRPTLVCGTAGCGKTLLAMEFLVRGATQFQEPGLFVAFEETSDELVQNVRSLGFDLDDLVASRQIAIDHIHVERSEIAETGDYDLEALFIRLGHAVDSIGAKRVVLDTLETLFSGFENPAILRAELRRLFRWLKKKKITAVITGERGDGPGLTRQGLEEYVSDCVIFLDHRVIDQISTRRLRIVKYRGSSHGTNEYPFIIDQEGLSVLPVTSLGLQHSASLERVTTGIAELDAMLGGDGYYRGSTVLVSGTAGTGKTSLAAQFALATCQRGEKCLYFAFEESQSQFFRNMRSIGVELEPWAKKALFHYHATRPTLYGLELHLATMQKLINRVRPHVVIVDPISNLSAAGTLRESSALLLRLLDHLKAEGITALFINLTAGGQASEQTDSGVSSLVDTWLLLRDIEAGGERNRGLYVLKSRGMAHSNQIREFLVTSGGIKLREVYLGPEGVLTGSLRVAQEGREKAAAAERKQAIARKQHELEQQRLRLTAQLAALQDEVRAAEENLVLLREEQQTRETADVEQHSQLAKSRDADGAKRARQKRISVLRGRNE